MRLFTCLILACVLPVFAQSTPAGPERLGTVSFAVSCAAGSQAAFNRGVALEHDFWYEEAKAQFSRLAASDPDCAMAHWGVAMSAFHEIWDRPDADARKLGWAQMQEAEQVAKRHPVTAREQAYLGALADFYRPGPADFPARVAAYSAAMGRLYASYPNDVDAGAFYALSLLADEQPNDTSLTQERKAMSVLVPLYAKAPDNPGVDHYIVHACDNPAMAADGLAAADHYGVIAASGPHAFHMPGHIYARLGLWPQDIASQEGSIAASEKAEMHGESGMMDEPHSYDFLLYAYLQNGQDRRAKATLDRMPKLLASLSTMPGRMSGMTPYFETKYTVFYDLEMRDWHAAATVEPMAGSSPEVEMLVYWARAVADGHLRQSAQAKADLARYDSLVAEIRKSKRAYIADGTGEKVTHAEMLGWVAFASGNQAEALRNISVAADLQDKVGQGEVDIPAREMLADMLLDSGHPREALAQYEVALRLSPNRLNGLYNAGRAAEAFGDKAKAEAYYRALLKSTDGGAGSGRPEVLAAKKFVESGQVAAR